MGSSHRLLDDPSSSSACPYLPSSPFAFPHHGLDNLDLFLPPPPPHHQLLDPSSFPFPPHAFLLHDCVAALELTRAPQPARRKAKTAEDAIRKAFAMGKRKEDAEELSPQDAALLIQMSWRAHLVHRSQVLYWVREVAIAKPKLKEIRSLYYSISYRRRITHDHEERQRFSEKINVLLLTLDAFEGPNYMVRTAKKSMLEELEGMLQIVDPQTPGKESFFNRWKFDLPQGGAIPNEKTAGVNNTVKVINMGKGK